MPGNGWYSDKISYSLPCFSLLPFCNPFRPLYPPCGLKGVHAPKIQKQHFIHFPTYCAKRWKIMHRNTYKQKSKIRFLLNGQSIFWTYSENFDLKTQFEIIVIFILLIFASISVIKFKKTYKHVVLMTQNWFPPKIFIFVQAMGQKMTNFCAYAHIWAYVFWS